MSGQAGAIRLFGILYRNKLLILVFTVLATLGAAVFSGPSFIPPRYTSEVILYPPSTNSNRMLIERDARFGSDKEIDEQIQLLRSSIVRDSIINKYQLYDHYSIDTTISDKRYRLNEKFSDRVKIERTRYNSISVIVSDTDPVKAAEIANDIVAIGDAYKSTIIKAKLKEAFDALSKTIFDLSFQIDQAADEINKAYKREVVTGSKINKATNVEQLKEQLDLKELMRVARETDRISQLEKLYFYESKLQQMVTVRMSYDQALVGLNNQIPTSFIISPAEVADKKSFPVRWIILVCTLLGSFIGICSIAVLLHNYRSAVEMLKQIK